MTFIIIITDSDFGFNDTSRIIVDNTSNIYYSDISHCIQNLKADNSGVLIIDSLKNNLKLDNSGVYIFNFMTKFTSEFIYDLNDDNYG